MGLIKALFTLEDEDAADTDTIGGVVGLGGSWTGSVICKTGGGGSLGLRFLQSGCSRIKFS